MGWLEIAFDRPVYLAGLLLLPVIWLLGRQRLTGMGVWRHRIALTLRSAVLIFIVLALAEIQLVRVSRHVVAMFLIDQSLSVEASLQDAAMAFASATADRGTPASTDASAGLIVFGSEARVEHPPLGHGSLPTRRQSRVDGAHTDLAAALRLAKATFPDGASRRIVVVSDGNENIGDALAEARELSDDGVGIDVVPLPARERSDVVVEKLTSPATAREGTPFDVTMVLEHRVDDPSGDSRTAAGRIVVTRHSSDSSQVVADQPVELPAGKSVLTFRQILDRAAFYSYRARFVPDQPAYDRFDQNNQASAFTHVQGPGRVLLLVSEDEAAGHDSLADVLRRHQIEVTVRSTAQLFTRLSELQNFDVVVMANVPRIGGDAPEGLQQFSDDQIEMLVRHVEQFGAGLVMIGGPDSLGAGGWAHTRLEEALPVDLHITNDKVAAVGALMLVIDKSGSMEGEKLALSKAAAQAAAEMLSPHDYLGVLAFDSVPEEIVRLQRVGQRPERVRALIGRLGSGGGTNLEPAMRRGYQQLRLVDASVKHMIVLTDGQTQGSGYAELAGEMHTSGITTTTVAVGSDAARGLLWDVAARGGGKFYQANNPRALPRIFTRETRRVMRPLVYEEPAGIGVQLAGHHEIVAGIAGPWPPITGYVLSSIKQNPLVEVPLVASSPAPPHNTLLAAWTYGLGRTVVWSTDLGPRWTSEWGTWAGREQLLVQMVRWAMRPSVEQGAFTLAVDHQEGRVNVTLHALSPDGEFLNGLPVQGILVPDTGGEARTLTFHQLGPGRYQCVLPLDDAGSHLLSVAPGPGHGVLRAGLTIPYSLEFRSHTTNAPLLQSLAALRPPAGPHGAVFELPADPEDWPAVQGLDVFRRDLPPGRSLTGVWPWTVVLAMGLFLLDVAHRRVFFQWPTSTASSFPATLAPSPSAATSPSLESDTLDDYASRLLRAKRLAKRG